MAYDVLTGEEVVSAVSLQIRNAFPVSEIAAVYTNKPYTEAERPYAFIHQVSAEHVNEMVTRGEWNFMLDIRVHPQRGLSTIDRWARMLAVRLLDVVNVIFVSGQQVKSRSFTWRLEEDVLHVIVTYAFKVRQAPTSGPIMEQVKITKYLKGVN